MAINEITSGSIVPNMLSQSAAVNSVFSLAITASSGASTVPFFIAPCDMIIIGWKPFVTTALDTEDAVVTLGNISSASVFATATISYTGSAKGDTFTGTITQAHVSRGTVLTCSQTGRSGSGVYRVQLDWTARGSL